MLTVKITMTGKTLADIEFAIDVAKEKIMGAFTIGGQSNETGSYSFEVEGEEEDDAEEPFDDDSLTDSTQLKSFDVPMD